MTSTKLSVDVQSIAGVVRIRLTGELDIAAIGAVEATAQLAIEHPGCTQLRLDLASVTFCDSSGLGVLVEIRSVCTDRGIDLVPERPQRRVRGVFPLTGLDAVS